MKFQVGDRVIILHSQEEGEVIDIINNKMVLIDVRGVQFPAYIDQLDFPYYKMFTEKKPAARKEKKFIDDVRKEKTKTLPEPDGMWLTFLPIFNMDEFGDEYVEIMKMHLVNRTPEACNFEYKLTYFGKEDFSLKNEVTPFQDFYLHDIPFDDLNDNPVFHFRFTLQQPDISRMDQFETSLRLKPKQLFNRIAEMRKKNEATFSFNLFKRYPDRSEEEIQIGGVAAGRVYSYADAKSFEPARTVVDLHIEKITDDWRSLQNFEILELQLKEFEKYYELAVANHLNMLTVIHGVGKGVLRDEIHDLLRMKKEVKSFVNQFHPLYGFGATEIYFK